MILIENKKAYIMSNVSVAERIKEILKDCGMKQSHLAEKLGLQRQEVNRLLQKNFSRSKYFPKIAEALGVTEAYLKYGVVAKQALMLDEIELLQLVEQTLSIDAFESNKYKDLLIKNHEHTLFFGLELRYNISPQLSAGSFIIYSSFLPRVKRNEQLYLLYVAEKRTLMAGKYYQDRFGKDEFLKNAAGIYLLQKGDLFVGLGIQAIVYF